MEVRRNERLVDMTQHLLNHPYESISLTSFAERYEFAGPSISEDLGIIKETFRERGYEALETVPGAAGDVLFIPEISYEEAKKYIESLAERLLEQDHSLPGGYAYLFDLLGKPELLRQVGGITASKYLGEKIDAVMTVATKGAPITRAASYCLSAPLVIVRRDSKITKGSAVSVNYVFGPSEGTEKMELSKRSLRHGSRILVVDNFTKGGGTVNGVKNLIEEFESELVGITVFVESKPNSHRTIDDYTSLLYVKDVDTQTEDITVVPGNYFSE